MEATLRVSVTSEQMKIVFYDSSDRKAAEDNHIHLYHFPLEHVLYENVQSNPRKLAKKRKQTSMFCPAIL